MGTVCQVQSSCLTTYVETRQKKLLTANVGRLDGVADVSSLHGCLETWNYLKICLNLRAQRQERFGSLKYVFMREQVRVAVLIHICKQIFNKFATPGINHRAHLRVEQAPEMLDVAKSKKKVEKFSPHSSFSSFSVIIISSLSRQMCFFWNFLPSQLHKATMKKFSEFWHCQLPVVDALLFHTKKNIMMKWEKVFFPRENFNKIWQRVSCYFFMGALSERKREIVSWWIKTRFYAVSHPLLITSTHIWMWFI